MSFYLTPPRMTREAFLERYGARMTRQAFRAWRFYERRQSLPVALVIGDTVSYARVITSPAEMRDFLYDIPENVDVEFYGVKHSDMMTHRTMAPEALYHVARSL